MDFAIHGGFRNKPSTVTGSPLTIAASRVAAIITKAPHLNFLSFFVLLILQFGMISWWSPNLIAFHSLISNIPLFQEIGLKIDFSI